MNPRREWGYRESVPPWLFERKSTLEKAEINQILIIKFKNMFRKIIR
jgi:hypothetical protein